MDRDQIFPVFQRRPWRWNSKSDDNLFILQDINFPEKFLEELECLENITSCNKVRIDSFTFPLFPLWLFFLAQVENYLLFSEFDQNLGVGFSSNRCSSGRKSRRKKEGGSTKSSWQIPLPKRRVSTIRENSV